MSLGGDDGYGEGYRGQDRARTGGTGAGGDDAHLTRTRLPEGDGDSYGTPRRTGRTKPSRNLITVVSVVVLLIAAIAFANRGGDDDSGGSGGSSSADGGGNDRDQAQPTAPTGVRPVDGKNPATGIASGFPRTEQGAQSAAANYAVALTSADMYDRKRRHALVPHMFTSAATKGMQNKFDKAYSSDTLRYVGLDENGRAADGLTYVSRTAPIGTKATKYTETTASVEVWCTGVFGTAGEGSKTPVTNDWFTMTLKLRWEANDWRVESFSQKNGPAPVYSDRTASTADEIAKAIEQYGGFTYAR
ncbi:hypothetical protein [Streptomyces sp. NPDC018031]|uniref:hypothetical protein n=1 Tax=Streptomyces sp. NPDC018031 TaxID=3365033 RepID=UPI0037908556